MKKTREFRFDHQGAIAVVWCLLLMLSSITTVAQLAAGKSKFLGNIIAGSTPSNFATYWNQVTPENGGKWGPAEPNRDSYSWGQLDNAYNYAKQRGFAFKGHTLVWGSQEPNWIGGLSQADQRAEVEEWIRDYAARYPNTDYIDVVNEPLHAPASFRNAIGGAGTTGWDWIVWSFEKARQYLPNAKLLINEYGIISDPNAANQYVNIINILKSRGLIDGIGIQCHYFNMNDVSTTTMNSVLNTLGNTGLPVYVSELDMTGSETQQRDRYQLKFPVLWNHSAVRGITLWGYIEGSTWAAGTGLLNSNGTERLAMQWLKTFMAGTNNNNLTVSPTALSVGTPAGNSTVTVTSNVSWTVSDNQTWITTSTASGSNNGTFTVSVTANTGAARSGTVTVAGGSITRTISVSQSGTGGGSNTIIVRARSVGSGASIQLRVNNGTIATWNLTTSYANYTATTTSTGGITVNFTNDATNRDAQVDYIQVNGSTRQAESQTTNTAVYQNGQCGGTLSEMMHCNGYIGFGNVSSASGRLAFDEGIPEQSLSTDWSSIPDVIFQNPVSNGKLIMETSTELTEVRILDFNGKTMKTVQMNGEQKFAEDLNLPPGLYILQPVNGTRKKKPYRLVVK